VLVNQYRQKENLNLWYWYRWNFFHYFPHWHILSVGWQKSLLLEWIFFSKMFVCLCYTIPNLKTDWWQIILSWSKYHYDKSPFCVFCLRTFFSVKTLKVISWMLFMLEICIVSIPFFVTRWTGTGYINMFSCLQ
jgi:hypothetical protein